MTCDRWRERWDNYRHQCWRDCLSGHYALFSCMRKGDNDAIHSVARHTRIFRPPPVHIIFRRNIRSNAIVANTIRRDRAITQKAIKHTHHRDETVPTGMTTAAVAQRPHPHTYGSQGWLHLTQWHCHYLPSAAWHSVPRCQDGEHQSQWRNLSGGQMEAKAGFCQAAVVGLDL